MTDDALNVDEETALPARRANRPITIGHRLELFAARALFFLFGLIGVDAASALAGGFLRHAGPLVRPISRRAENNLRMIFPDWDETKIRRVTADIWENLGRTAAEFNHLEELVPFGPDSRVEVVGEARLRTVAAGAGPAIFVSGHFANWEAMSIAFYAAGVEYATVYRAANNPLVDELIINMRAKVMSRALIPKGKRGGRALIETLKAGRSLAMLVDQKLNDGIAAPFLGREAMTAPAAARLSLKFSAPVIPVSAERLKGAHFRVTVHEPIAFAPSGDVTADVLALTTLINQHLERDILARPEQWLWMHRRWPKSR